MVELKIRPFLATILTSLFIVSVPVIEYENWLFYEYPTAVLLVLSTLFLCQFIKFKKFSACLCFFSLLAAIVYIRGILSIYWLLGVILILIIFNWNKWKKILLGCSIPFLLVFALYFKNYLIFNSFSISDAQIGINLAVTVTNLLSQEEQSKLITQKKITGLHHVPPFSMDMTKYTQHGIHIVNTEIPLLDQIRKSTGAINTHHLVYLDVGKKNMADATYVLRMYPRLILHERYKIFSKKYFLTSDHCDPYFLGGNSEKFIIWRRIFKEVFFRLGGSGYLVLKYGLPLLFLYGFFLIIQSIFNNNYIYQRSVVSFMMFSIIFLILSTFFVWGDYPRYRFMIDAFYMVIFGLLINNIISFIKKS